VLRAPRAVLDKNSQPAASTLDRDRSCLGSARSHHPLVARDRGRARLGDDDPGAERVACRGRLRGARARRRAHRLGIRRSAHCALRPLRALAALAATGWLYSTDAFWGDRTVEQIHLDFAWAIVALAALHVAGVVVTGIVH